MSRGIVNAQFTMSLDGFIAGPDDGVREIMAWYTAGDTEYAPPKSDLVFKVSRLSARLLQEEWGALGVIVTGRRDFDVSRAWGGAPPLGLPMFIVTHRIPQEWVYEGSPFTFVTQGVEQAVAMAKKAAGDKNVSVGGTRIVQQCLKAGLLDEIQIDLAPVLLGAGIRLFDNLEGDSIQLELITMLDGTGVTHLKYRVVK